MSPMDEEEQSLTEETELSEEEAEEEDSDNVDEAESEIEPETPIDFAKIQAEAILAAAHQEAEEIKERARAAAEAELRELQRAAKEEGYSRGYAEGMAEAMAEGKLQREEMALAQQKEVKEFLETAVRLRDQMIERSKDDLKELALVIAEKIIRISLRSSADILLRMIEAATEKRRRCEWVQIYIADCDAKNMTYTVPQLAAALRHVSDRVRIIPMADDESGTCIIEMPDEIIDASVSTQLDNLRGVISDAEPDKGEISYV